jgi:ComF family protein
MITSVPLRNGRLVERGFNQSRVLACEISKEFGIPFSEILSKSKNTRHQNELSREERLVNLEGSFKANPGNALRGAKVLLIDDVMTTGATLNECSKVLLHSGAKVVRCFTLARGA